MTEEQINIGNKLLEIIISNDGQLAESNYNSSLKSIFGDDKTKLINTTVTTMIEDYKLLRRNITNASLKIITADGEQAYKIGLKQFIKEFEERKELEKEHLRANIKTARQSFWISIIALIAAVFAPILAALVSHYIENADCLKSKNNYKPQNNTQNIFIGQDSISNNSAVEDSINISNEFVHD